MKFFQKSGDGSPDLDQQRLPCHGKNSLEFDRFLQRALVALLRFTGIGIGRILGIMIRLPALPVPLQTESIDQ